MLFTVKIEKRHLTVIGGKLYAEFISRRETKTDMNTLVETCRKFGKYTGRYQHVGWKFRRGLEEVIVWPGRGGGMITLPEWRKVK